MKAAIHTRHCYENR